MPGRLDRNPLALAAVFAVYFGLGLIGLVVAGVGGFQQRDRRVAAERVCAGRAPHVRPRRVARGLRRRLLRLLPHERRAPQVARPRLGNTFEAVVGAMLIERVAGGLDVFRSSRTVFRFAAVAMVSTGITATLGALSVDVRPRSRIGATSATRG